MIEALATRSNIIKTIVLLVICGSLGVAATLVGISDNPPGILLAFLSSIAFVLSFVHPWRTSKRFQFLTAASGLGFAGFVILHGVFDEIAFKLGDANLASQVLSGAGVAFFIIALFLCPPGFLVGLIGFAITSKRERRSQKEPPAR